MRNYRRSVLSRGFDWALSLAAIAVGVALIACAVNTGIVKTSQVNWNQQAKSYHDHVRSPAVVAGLNN